MSEIRFNRWSHQSGTGGIYQDSSGNIGIGTSTPTSVLDIQGGSIKIGNDLLTSSGVSTFTSGLSVTGGVTVGTGATLDGSTNTITASTNGSERLRITNTGNVGIGTDNPNERVTITSTTLASYIQLCDSSTGTTVNDGAFVGSYNGDVELKTKENKRITLGTNNTERLRITSSGNVGIGTNDPGTKLDLLNGSDAAVILQVTGADTSSEYLGLGVNGSDAIITGGGNGSTSTNLILKTADSGTETERLRITSDGKIGINNTNPLYAMHFKNAMSSTPSYIHMEVTGTNTVGGGGGIQFDTSASSDVSNNGLYLAQISGERSSSDDGSNQLVFKTSNAGSLGDDGNTHSPKTRMIIDEDGHVTISDGNLIIGTSGHGIDFSATANGFNTSGVSELLDDYEQGTWTPTIRFGGSSTGVTYNEQSGTYIKIGNLVHLNVVLALANKGSQTGDAEIGGYPFPTGGSASGSSSSRATGTVSFADSFSSLNSVPVIYSAGLNFSYGRLHHVNSSSGSGSGHAVLQNTNLTNGTTIRASITYTTF